MTAYPELKDFEPEKTRPVPLTFGTGGIRGKWGDGPGRMNTMTARRVALGYGGYLNSSFRDHSGSGTAGIGSLPGAGLLVVLARDTRSSSPALEEEIVRVLSALGIDVARFEGPVPTPVLSYAVRRMNAAGGIVVTASHNPPDYNGIKIYGPDGCQAVPALARAISAFIDPIDPEAPPDPAADHIPSEGIRGSRGPEAGPGREAFAPEGGVCLVHPDILDDYLTAACDFIRPQPSVVSSFGVAFSSLGGTGIYTVPRALESLGCQVTLVEEQSSTDGSFAFVPSPNPEEPSALEMAVDLARKNGLAMAIATDPDCDRLGVAVLEPGGGIFAPNGHQIAVLLLDFVLSAAAGQVAGSPDKASGLPLGAFTATTVVTTPLFEKISRGYGVPCLKTLTGFKYIGELITRYESTGEGVFLFGAEESLGYLAGTHVRDKDATQAAALFVTMEKQLRSAGSTARKHLDGIMVRHGRHAEKLITVALEGQVGPGSAGETAGLLRGNPALFTAALLRRIPDLSPEPVRVLDYAAGCEILDGAAVPMNPPLPSTGLITLLGGEWSVSVRPSGTEPKMKVYLSSWEDPGRSCPDCGLVLKALEGALRELTVS